MEDCRERTCGKYTTEKWTIRDGNISAGPVLSGPVPVFYPAASDSKASEEESKLEMQGQRLRERREQLAREEEAWKMKLKQ